MDLNGWKVPPTWNGDEEAAENLFSLWEVASFRAVEVLHSQMEFPGLHPRTSHTSSRSMQSSKLLTFNDHIAHDGRVISSFQ